jgi:hypothetical protein
MQPYDIFGLIAISSVGIIFISGMCLTPYKSKLNNFLYNLMFLGLIILIIGIVGMISNQ